MYHPVDAHYIVTLKVCAETVLLRLNHIKHSHALQADQTVFVCTCIWLTQSYNLVCGENKSLRTVKVACNNAHRSIQRCNVFIHRTRVYNLKKGRIYVSRRLIGLHNSTKKCIINPITISPNRVLIPFYD